MKSLLVSLTAAAVLCLAGCASTPGAAGDGAALQAVALESVTSIAVSRVITRDNATPAKAQERAERIVAIASALQALGTDALSTLPAATAALAPLLDKAGLDP